MQPSRHLPFYDLTANLAEKFPSAMRISPSEFGEMFEKSSGVFSLSGRIWLRNFRPIFGFSRQVSDVGKIVNHPRILT